MSAMWAHAMKLQTLVLSWELRDSETSFGPLAMMFLLIIVFVVIHLGYREDKLRELEKMPITSQSIKDVRFSETGRGHGSDPGQVRLLLDRIAAELESMTAERDTLQVELERMTAERDELRAAIAEYQSQERILQRSEVALGRGRNIANRVSLVTAHNPES